MSISRCRNALAAFALAAAFLPSLGRAQVVTFEDYPVPPGAIALFTPFAGYNGFTWACSGTCGVVANPYAGLTHMYSSGIRAMFYNWDNVTKMSSTSAFNLVSVNLSSYRSPHSIVLSGWLGGVLQYADTVSGSISSAPLYALGYSNIDEFRFSTDGDRVTGTSFIDDIRTTSAVPEPASLALVATGLLGVGVVTRRRRTACS